MSEARGSLRARVEEASRPAILRLSKVPRILPFILMLALIIGGLALGGVIGFALIMIGVLFLAWLLYLSYPRLSQSERLMRVAVIALGTGLAVTRLFPHS